MQRIGNLEYLTLVLMIIVPCANATYKKPDPFKCSEDYCNINDDFQYCSETFEMCRNCMDVEDSCGKPSQPLKCMGYCLGIGVEEEIKKIRTEEAAARSCPVSPMMMIIADGKVDGVKNIKDGKLEAGSSLTYSCNDGFLLKGVNTHTCSSDGTWNQTAMPYCIDASYTKYKKIIIWLSVICGVMGMVLITAIVYIVKILSMKTISRSPTGSNLDEESYPETHSLLAKSSTSIVLDEGENGRGEAKIRGGDDDEGEETAPTEISTSNYRNQDGSETNVDIPKPPTETSPSEPKPKPKETVNDIDNAPRESGEAVEDIGNTPTVESNENYPVEETTGGKSKGTKPLAARDGEQPNEVPLKMAEGPEVLPPEDTHENSPTKESEREEFTKDIGWQDRTYPVRDTLPDKEQTKSKQLVV